MATQKLSAFEKIIIKELSGKPSLAASLLDGWPEGDGETIQSVKKLIELAQLGVSEEGSAYEILEKLTSLGVVKKVSSGYVPESDAHIDQFKRIAFALNVIELYKENIHLDETVARIVLTKPPMPSTLEKKLSEVGWKTSDIEPTDNSFKYMVRAAKKKVVIMTPFLDAKGALWLKELFALASEEIDRVLILRGLEMPVGKSYPMGYDLISTWLKEHSVTVYNYSIPRHQERGRETFHAKVVLCDRKIAYVGSSNMNTASLEHSMELGVVMEGKAAGDAAVILDAVIGASEKWM